MLADAQQINRYISLRTAAQEWKHNASFIKDSLTPSLNTATWFLVLPSHYQAFLSLRTQWWTINTKHRGILSWSTTTWTPLKLEQCAATTIITIYTILRGIVSWCTKISLWIPLKIEQCAATVSEKGSALLDFRWEAACLSGQDTGFPIRNPGSIPALSTRCICNTILMPSLNSLTVTNWSPSIGLDS